MDKKQLKRIIFYITMLIYMLINVFTSRAEEASAGEYFVGLDYYTRYNLKGSLEFTELGQYSISNQPYFESWSDKRTWTIDNPSSSVAIYSLLNKYNSSSFTFSVKSSIENNNVGSSINTFKIYNMHCFFYLRPEHIFKEAHIQGSFINYLSRDLMETAHIRLQARSRVNGEWVTLKQYQITDTTTVIYLDWQSNDNQMSINYSEYRLNVLYWNFYNNGLTLIANGVASSEQKICSFDFVGAETDNTAQKLDDLISRQDSIITKLGDITNDISNIGDLIVNLPDLILDGVYNLFVPDDIQTIFNDKVEVLKTKMGILFLPFDFVLTELEYILDYNPKSTITLPELKVMNEPIMERTTFDIADVGSMRVSSADDWDKVTIIEIVRFFTTLLIIYSIVHLAIDLAEALFGWYMKDVHEDISPEWNDETQDKGD